MGVNTGQAWLYQVHWEKWIMKFNIQVYWLWDSYLDYKYYNLDYKYYNLDYKYYNLDYKYYNLDYKKYNPD